ncbi:hypothetical protein MCOR27_008785 [Pyricularia oryzae]|uniref:HMG box domain-containing protein n=5 Tax=Pyricularia TaxID=48558 RepID=A0ABQ8NBM5_PYRGI|nr:uncharacterized protein MGG_01641 [Pyricularia oryzae 70-15]ELQ43278.1 hypothetical protein OOU_Y34scaffold00162g47 [Pyricularia oryzae Y34]KAH8839050.1 hypothetical protein MCOR01_008285 [Pyricularia oryzae]KAI6294363.1 hypothetical protein MCOR33_008478 [Pyricularia grisea]EHA54822.1 hypothetical protein MGG_01641 [Pyricularia oryzae 70-15]KAH9438892.1 hypothetical protein MCOR02_002485 [Pyricularia oryzae]
MSQSLAEIFMELGISQYLDAFVDQGFDTWDTILDITESDLDALNVKLGHRRKLQRRIANSRGFAPDAALASPTGTSSQRNSGLDDAQRTDIQRTEAPKPETTIATVVTKRKYRRHPKADENAPERPPSAYVLFSNKTRDDLKDRNLTFTEIAKLVGENWQALTPAEKEPYETQAQTAKEKYNADLAEYKQTTKYKEYLAYLQDFKAKHATPSSTDGKDCQKRIKLSDASIPLGAPRRARSQTSTGLGSGSRSASRNGSRSNSRSDGRKGSEPPPTHREHRVNSVSSITGDYTTSSNNSYIERSSVERSPSLSASPRDPPLNAAPVPAWLDGHSGHQHQQHQHGRHTLPSLSNILEGQVVESCESRGSGGAGYTPFSFQHAASIGPPGSPPGLIGGDSSYPLPMRKELSSGASTTSASSVGGYPHTPVEGSLPIHLLLVSGNGKHDQDRQRLKRSLSPEGRPSLPNLLPDRHPSSDPPSTLSISPPLSSAQGYFPPMSAPPTMSSHAPSRGPTLPGLAKFDGMSALLQAGEIVGRQVR